MMLMSSSLSPSRVQGQNSPSARAEDLVDLRHLVLDDLVGPQGQKELVGVARSHARHARAPNSAQLYTEPLERTNPTPDENSFV